MSSFKPNPLQYVEREGSDAVMTMVPTKKDGNINGYGAVVTYIKIRAVSPLENFNAFGPVGTSPNLHSSYLRSSGKVQPLCEVTTP